MEKLSNREPLPIFIDTNVLLHAPEWKVRFLSELDRIVGQSYVVYLHEMVFDELLAAHQEGGALGQRAKLALELSNQFQGYEDPREYAGTDVALMASAKREGGAVLTFDKLLKKRCKNIGVPVITIKGTRQLMVDGFLE